MSHFTVIVIGPDYEAQLQPFHEFECIGIDDEHVINVDETERFLAEYKNEKQTLYRISNGTGSTRMRTLQRPATRHCSVRHRSRWPMGSMGWFGCSSGEDPDWATKAVELLMNLPPDTILTLVDCHI